MNVALVFESGERVAAEGIAGRRWNGWPIALMSADQYAALLTLDGIAEDAPSFEELPVHAGAVREVDGYCWDVDRRGDAPYSVRFQGPGGVTNRTMSRDALVRVLGTYMHGFEGDDLIDEADEWGQAEGIGIGDTLIFIDCEPLRSAE